VTWLSRWLPRSLAAVGTYFGLLALAFAGSWIFLPTFIAQGRAFAADLPTVQVSLRTMIDHWSPVGLDHLVSTAEGYLTQFSGQLVALPMAFFSVAANLVLVVFLSLYWLIAQPALRGWVLGLIPDERRNHFRGVLTEAGQTVGGYVRGVILSAVSIAILTYIGLRLLGVPSPLVLAVLAGFGELIPVLGPLLAMIPAVAVALAAGEVNPLLVVVFYIALQQVESNLLLPLIMRGQARIPPLLSLVAFLFGAAVGGIVGALIAIPLFGALRVVVIRMLVPVERHLAGVSRAEALAVHRAELKRDAADGA
jgi:predicted PurR-regulated permease PerM